MGKNFPGREKGRWQDLEEGESWWVRGREKSQDWGVCGRVAGGVGDLDCLGAVAGVQVGLYLEDSGKPLEDFR